MTSSESCCWIMNMLLRSRVSVIWKRLLDEFIHLELLTRKVSFQQSHILTLGLPFPKVPIEGQTSWFANSVFLFYSCSFPRIQSMATNLKSRTIIKRLTLFSPPLILGQKIRRPLPAVLSFQLLLKTGLNWPCALLSWLMDWLMWAHIQTHGHSFICWKHFLWRLNLTMSSLKMGLLLRTNGFKLAFPLTLSRAMLHL